MATDRRALLVLGMHRSGTSALARVLNIYGAALPSDLLPANSGNTTGYWESAAVVRFNDALLGAMGSPWDDPSWFSLAPLSADTTKEYARGVAALVASEFGGAPLVVVKDPRLCRLMPIWREGLALLQMPPLPILLLRNPLESAASLRVRDNMPEGAGLLLWLQYVLAAEHASRPLQRAIVFYDDLLSDCPRVIDRIQSQLGVTFSGRSPATDAQAVAFVRPALRHEHTSGTSVQTRDDISRWVRTVYTWFERARTEVPTDTADLDAVRSELAEAERLFGPSLRWRLVNEQQRATHAEAPRWKVHVNALDAQSRDQVQGLESRLAVAMAADAAWREERTALTSRLVEAHSSETTLREQVQAVESRLAALGGVHAALSARMQRIEATLAWRVWRRILGLQNRLSGG